jgi:antitoxin PrlF
MRRAGSPVRDGGAAYGAAGGTISSKGQITIPKAVRDRYGLTTGSEVEFEMREEGALLRRRRPERHPVWDQIGSLRDGWRWPKGVPHTVDAYVDFVRGGSYAEWTGRKPRKSRRR